MKKLKVFLILTLLAISMFVTGCSDDTTNQSNNNQSENLSVTPQFNNEDFNNDENADDFVSLVSTQEKPIPYDHYEFNRMYYVDMNNDGVEDRVTVTLVDDQAKVKANDAFLNIENGSQVQGFQITDINLTDPYKEIVVYKRNQGLDVELYEYDGNSINYLGSGSDIDSDDLFKNEEILDMLSNRNE